MASAGALIGDATIYGRLMVDAFGPISLDGADQEFARQGNDATAGLAHRSATQAGVTGSVIPQHLSTQELAERLSVHPETLRRAAQRGDLKPIRIGRDLRWPEDEVERWLAQR